MENSIFCAVYYRSTLTFMSLINHRSSRSEVFLGKDVLKICSKFTGEHPCQSVISIKPQSNFIEITLQHECSPVNLLHNFRTPFPKNTYGGLLLQLERNHLSHFYQKLNDLYKCFLNKLISYLQFQIHMQKGQK